MGSSLQKPYTVHFSHFRRKTNVGMGRGKVKMKRIEDKSNRQVSFTKRRNGLMKKSHELAVLCDVDVAAFVFSGTGRLYEFSTGESMTNILTRYESFKKMGELTRIHVYEKLATEYRDVCAADELVEMIERHLEEKRIKLLDIIGLEQLEQHLGSFLQQVRIRKTHLKMGVVKALQDKETELKKERQFMMEEIAAARMKGINNDSSDAEQPRLPTMDIHITW